MSKILKVAQKIFGSTAAGNQVSVFGSFQAGSPAFTTATDAAGIQSLSQFQQGWFGAVAVNGGIPAAPAIEDENSLDALWSRQIAYGFQSGVPEWDAVTIYFQNSVVQSGGLLWLSLVDNNQNNAVVEGANWTQISVSPTPASGIANAAVFSGSGSITSAANTATLTYMLLRSGKVVNFSVSVATTGAFTTTGTVFGLGIPLPAGYTVTTSQQACCLDTKNSGFYRVQVNSSGILILKIDNTLAAATWIASESSNTMNGSYMIY